MAKVVLVRIPSLFTGGSLALTQIPPVGLAYVAGYLRHRGHDVQIIDSIGEALEQIYGYGKPNFYINGLTTAQIIQAIPSDTRFIGISFPFSHEWPLAKKVCSAVKRHFPNALLVGGGEHITAMPQFCLNDCPPLDYCVLGEGEETFHELIVALENGRGPDCIPGIAYRRADNATLITPARGRIEDISCLPYPAWDLIPLENYLKGGYSFGVDLGRTVPMVASRGCPYRCAFCSNPSMWRRRWVVREPHHVVAEMEGYIRRYGIQNFDFYDMTLIVRKDWIRDFCRLLIERKLNIAWQVPGGTRSEALDEEILGLLRQSGCRNLSYAPESGSIAVLEKVGKKVDLNRMIFSMKSAVSHGLNIKANMIVGFPGEKLKDVIQSYRLILRMAAAGVHDVSLWTFTAYPGTEIFDEMVREKRLSVFDENYFLSLLSYSDLARVVSWSRSFSSCQLKFLRVLGFLLFYAASYLFRPIRLARTLWNLARHRPQSRLEMIVEKAIGRHRKAPGNLMRVEKTSGRRFRHQRGKETRGDH